MEERNQQLKRKVPETKTTAGNIKASADITTRSRYLMKDPTRNDRRVSIPTVQRKKAPKKIFFSLRTILITSTAKGAQSTN